MALPLYPTLFKAEMTQEQLKNFGSSTFETHTSKLASYLHRFSETIWLPARLNAQLIARTLESLPGANKDRLFLGLIIKISSLALSIITLPLAIISLILAFPLRLLDHQVRPAMSYINNSMNSTSRAKTKNDLQLTPERSLHIRTHNVGFVTSSMSIVGDLRDPVVRAKELVESILNDPLKPDVICFQETFHEDATRTLCEGILKDYPYIIHNVAPQISGLNSGAMIASKYPFTSAVFHRFDHMLSPETAAPRGIFRVSIESTEGPVYIYNVHTQSLLGKDRAQARFQQLEQIKQFMDADLKENPKIGQVLMGDFNTSHVDAWGNNNMEPKGQAEEPVYKRLNEYFEDLFLHDHDPLTGARISGKTKYLDVDNERMNETLPEPSGTWYYGPFANIGLILKFKMWFDCWKNGLPFSQKVKEIKIPKKISWGTHAWRREQPANTARFDYILVRKEQKGIPLDGRVEIRRVIVPKDAQSGFDHLPVDAIITLRQ